MSFLEYTKFGLNPSIESRGIRERMQQLFLVKIYLENRAKVTKT